MNAIPWYRSPVFIGAVTSVIAQVLVLLGKQDIIPPEVLNSYVEAVFQVIALVAATYAGIQRARSTVQPITVTKNGAEVLNSQGGFSHPGALSLVAVMSVVSGCAALGLAQPKSFNERIAAGFSTVTAVHEATSAYVDAKVRQAATKPEAERSAYLAAVRKDAENILKQADSAMEGLNVARSLQVLDIQTAEARLVSTLTILESLQRYLEGK
jgi:hypothetical protein